MIQTTKQKRDRPVFNIGDTLMHGRIVGIEDGSNRNAFVANRVDDWVYLVQPASGKYQQYTQAELLN